MSELIHPEYDPDATTEYTMTEFKVEELRQANLAWMMVTKAGSVNLNSPQAKFYSERASELSRELFYKQPLERESVAQKVAGLVRRLFER